MSQLRQLFGAPPPSLDLSKERNHFMRDDFEEMEMLTKNPKTSAQETSFISVIAKQMDILRREFTQEQTKRLYLEDQLLSQQQELIKISRQLGIALKRISILETRIIPIEQGQVSNIYSPSISPSTGKQSSGTPIKSSIFTPRNNIVRSHFIHSSPAPVNHPNTTHLTNSPTASTSTTSTLTLTIDNDNIITDQQPPNPTIVPITATTVTDATKETNGTVTTTTTTNTTTTQETAKSTTLSNKKKEDKAKKSKGPAVPIGALSKELKVQKQKQFKSRRRFKYYEFNDSDWDKYFNQLKELVTRTKEWPSLDFYEEPELYKWVNAQIIERKNNNLSEEKQKMLEDLGCKWIRMRSNATWDDHFKRLVELKNLTGDFDVFKVPNKFQDDRCFTNWISNTKSRWRKGQLTENQFDQLKSIGFTVTEGRKTYDGGPVQKKSLGRPKKSENQDTKKTSETSSAKTKSKTVTKLTSPKEVVEESSSSEMSDDSDEDDNVLSLLSDSDDEIVASQSSQQPKNPLKRGYEGPRYPKRKVEPKLYVDLESSSSDEEEEPQTNSEKT